MPRKPASGWVWNVERAEFLIECIEKDFSCGQIAQCFNERYQEEVPSLAFNKDSILAAVKSKTVSGLLVGLCGPERAQNLVIMARRSPSGRPKGAKDKKPRKTPVRTKPPVPSTKRVTAQAFLAYRAKNKDPTQ